MGHNNKIRWS